MHDENLYFKSKLAIAKALGVHRHTIDLWEQKTWFPRKTKEGWLKDEVLKSVDEYQASKDGANDTYAEGSREEKIALECKHLKIKIQKEQELLEQAKEATRALIEEGKVASRKLIEKKEVQKGLDSLLSGLRSKIESWAKTCEADDPDNHSKYRKAVDIYLGFMNDEISTIGK